MRKLKKEEEIEKRTWRVFGEGKKIVEGTRDFVVVVVDLVGSTMEIEATS